MVERIRGARVAVAVLAAGLVVGPVGLAGATPESRPGGSSGSSSAGPGATRDGAPSGRVTDQHVREARAAATSGATAVARAEVELAELSTLREAAWVSAQVAAEDYTTALVALEEAQSTAVRARERLAGAEAELEEARRELGALAQHAYRSGGNFEALQALLSADGLDEVLARSDALALQSQRSDAVVQRFQAAEVVAQTLGDRAASAEEQQVAASAEAEQRHLDAQQAQLDADERVAAAETRRDELIVELATLRSTSVEVERARQEQLDADRAARAQAQAAAERAAAGGGAGTGAGTQDPPGQSPPASPPPSPGPSPGPTPSPGPSTPSPAPTPAPSPSPEPSPTQPPPAQPPPSSGPGLGHGVSRGSAAQGQAAVAWAMSQVGKGYLLGATGPDLFDCSGLTSRAWGAQGVNTTRTSRSQYVHVLKISYADLRPGDLVFWGTDKNDPQSIYHVAMYIGGGQIVEALNPSTGVVVRNLASRAPAAQMPFAGRP